jgi:hypothetical protein
MGRVHSVLLRLCHSQRVKPWKAELNLPQSSNCDGDISCPRRYKRYIGLHGRGHLPVEIFKRG